MILNGKLFRLLALVSLSVLLSSCTGIPEGLSAVRQFDGQRYLGTWYEIARLDHSFERGLSNVSAQYEARDDGGITVINRGFDQEDNEWSEARGKAYYVETPDIGRLKVSFFGPFYGGYNVLLLDSEYQYALVSGPDRDYLWILARSKTLDAATRDILVQQATDFGFATRELVWVKHDREDPML